MRSEPLLADPVPRVRKAVVRALSRVDGGAEAERFPTALEDPSAGVANAARGVLRDRLHLVPRRLWSAFLTAARPHARRMVLSLAAALGWWDSAPLLVAAAGSADEEERRAALEYLGLWRRNARRLTGRAAAEQLVLLEQMLREHGGRLDEASRHDLEDHLAFARREWAGGDG